MILRGVYLATAIKQAYVMFIDVFKINVTFKYYTKARLKGKAYGITNRYYFIL